jgi:chromosome segregation ATPase
LRYIHQEQAKVDDKHSVTEKEIGWAQDRERALTEDIELANLSLIEQKEQNDELLASVASVKTIVTDLEASKNQIKAEHSASFEQLSALEEEISKLSSDMLNRSHVETDISVSTAAISDKQKQLEALNSKLRDISNAIKRQENSDMALRYTPTAADLEAIEIKVSDEKKKIDEALAQSDDGVAILEMKGSISEV